MPDEMEEKVIKATSDALTSVPVKSIQVRTRLKSFLDGRLYFVYYQLDHEAKEKLIYAYLKGDDVILINNVDELATVMSAYSPESGGHKLLKDVFSLGSVAGFIAVLITLTICYLVAYRGVEKPPEVLSAALTAILGFYFGSQVARPRP